MAGELAADAMELLAKDRRPARGESRDADIFAAGFLRRNLAMNERDAIAIGGHFLGVMLRMLRTISIARSPMRIDA